MDNRRKVRWTFLGVALAVTLIAVAYPVEETIEVQAEPRSPRAVVKAESKSAPVADESDNSPEWVALDDDPFAAQKWAPPPVALPVGVAPVARAVETIDVSVPPPTPPLPFQFIGQMDTGSEQIIYLGRGDQIQTAKIGETLDAKYKLVSVSNNQLEFELVATGQRQSLLIPAMESR